MRGLGCLLLLPVIGLAQCNYATLRGSVADPQNRPVEAALVALKSMSTEAVRKTSADGNGFFELAGLAPDDYELEVRAPGLAPLTRRLSLEVAQQMRLDLTLSLGQQQQAIQVVGAPELLKTADTTLGEVIEPESIKELPLNGRMLLDLALTVPGSHVSHGAQTGDMNPLYWRPGQRSAISVGGNRPNANLFLLDGATDTDPTFNTLNLSPSPDAVEEFKVQTASYLAEMGGAGGGQVNIVTRSGTRSYHGTAYEFLRNNAMDALSFLEMPGTNHLVQNNFGASLGGPVKGNSTFFFANYEGFRMGEAMTMLDTVPTAAEAGGDFSQSGVAIYDPQPPRTASALSSPGTGFRLPA